MRRIFAEAVCVVSDVGLRSKVEAAALEEDTSYTVSDLERANSELRSLLIELHEYIESVLSDPARHIEAMIWSELVASTERRRLSMGPF
jgi:hypothetical protein